VFTRHKEERTKGVKICHVSTVQDIQCGEWEKTMQSHIEGEPSVERGVVGGRSKLLGTKIRKERPSRKKRKFQENDRAPAESFRRCRAEKQIQVPDMVKYVRKRGFLRGSFNGENQRNRGYISTSYSE